jgi:hypothetical protein
MSLKRGATAASIAEVMAHYAGRERFDRFPLDARLRLDPGAEPQAPGPNFDKWR